MKKPKRWSNILMAGNRIIIRFYFILTAFILVSSSMSSVASAGYVTPRFVLDAPVEAPFAEVGDGSSGTVHITGKVVYEKVKPREYEQLLFSFETDTQVDGDVWGASIFPLLGQINPNENSMDIDIYITAPLYESVDEYRNVRLGGTYVSNPSGWSGEIEANNVYVRVAPYIKFVTYSVEGFQRVYPGQKAHFSIGIMNFGNRVESFTVQVTNTAILQDQGISVVFPSETVEVGPKNETIFKFTVYGTDQFFHPWRSQMTTISLLVTPTNELPEGLSKDQPLEYFAQEWYVFYYEFGPEWPDTCYCWTILGVVLITAIYWYFRGKDKQRRRLKKMLRKQRREERRQRREKLD